MVVVVSLTLKERLEVSTSTDSVTTCKESHIHISSSNLYSELQLTYPTDKSIFPLRSSQVPHDLHIQK
jgi:hypothetical protein